MLRKLLLVLFALSTFAYAQQPMNHNSVVEINENDTLYKQNKILINIYDLWSDAVKTASRMVSTGEKDHIQLTESFKKEIEKHEGTWQFTLLGEFEVKGKGLMKTYYLG